MEKGWKRKNIEDFFQDLEHTLKYIHESQYRQLETGMNYDSSQKNIPRTLTTSHALP